MSFLALHTSILQSFFSPIYGLHLKQPGNAVTKERAWLMREYPDPELKEHFGRGEDVECVHFLCIFLLSLALFYSKGGQIPTPLMCW